MTSYEHAYCTWFWKNNLKRMLVYIGVLLTVFLLPALFSMREQKTITSLPLNWALYLLLAINLALAILLPVVLFRFLMQKRSCDLYLPLPIKRSHFFFIQFVIGLIIMIIPHIIFYLAIMLDPSNWVYFEYYIAASLGVFIILLALFSCILFFVMKCNSLWDAIIIAIGIPLVSFMIFATLQEMLDVVVRKSVYHNYNYSVSEFFPMNEVSSYFSPILACSNLLKGLGESFQANDIWDQWITSQGLSIKVLLYWMFLTIVFIIAALRSYQKRLGEDSEQRTTSRLVYPMLIFFITMCLMLQNITNLSMFWLIIVVYFTLQFVAKRKITIRFHMIASLIVMATIASLTSNLLIQSKGFGQVYEIIERDMVVNASISVSFCEPEAFDLTNEKYRNIKDKKIGSGNGRSEDDQETVDMIYELHERLLADRQDEKDYVFKDDLAYIDINYRLKNGKTSLRSFIIDDEAELVLVKQLVQIQIDQGRMDLKPYNEPL